MKRLGSIGLILLMLSSLFVAPTRVELVCRISGEPMSPVVASPETEKSCCAVTQSVGTNGTARYRLTNPGCCDLVITAGADHPPAMVGSADLSIGFALVPEVASLAVPALHAVSLRPALWREAAPRAPPLRACSPRAPPSFS